MVGSAERGASSSEQVDALYLELRKELRAARDRLADAIDGVRAESGTPTAGDDPLKDLPEEVDRTVPHRKRAELEREAERLQKLELELRQEEFESHYRHVVALNRDRLSLYPFLSPARRGEIAGFGPAGLDQASAELRQVLLVFRHHVRTGRQFLASVAEPGASRSKSALTVALVAAKWLLPLGVFVWWRRRAPRLLTALRDSAREQRRKARQVDRSPMERLLGIAMRVHGPVEWLLLLTSVMWILPPSARSLLEVQLAWTVFGWFFGGAAVVATIDALAGHGERNARVSRLVTAHVRLRSLRLIGMVVVAVGMILSISDQLVGKGTIYSWVLSTFWFAAIPVTLVLVRWWRAIVFERVELKRRKTAFDQWVLHRAAGWQSAPAALAAGLVLLAGGGARAVRLWVGRFDVTRRVLAYLFRRDMHRNADGRRVTYDRIPDALFEKMGPSTPSRELVPSVADEEVERTIARVAAVGGGVFAVVGERGAGKSTLLGRILSRGVDAKLVECPVGGASAFGGALARAAGLEGNASLDDAASAMDAEGRDPGCCGGMALPQSSVLSPMPA
jgi:hypothetical protein